MAAKKGNAYAQKWDETEVLRQLKKIEVEAKKATCLWLGSALVKCGLYADIWGYWKKTFKKNEEVFRTIKRVEQIFEDRLFSGALNGKYNPTTAIFGLKNNHGWKDKNETDITSGGKPITPPPSVNLTNASTEELEHLAEILTNLGGNTARTGKA